MRLEVGLGILEGRDVLLNLDSSSGDLEGNSGIFYAGGVMITAWRLRAGWVFNGDVGIAYKRVYSAEDSINFCVLFEITVI